MNNGKRGTEHPKALIEVIENTRAAVEGYAQTHKISEVESALILVLNELRCIHWHLDQSMAVKDGQLEKK